MNIVGTTDKKICFIYRNTVYASYEREILDIKKDHAVLIDVEILSERQKFVFNGDADEMNRQIEIAILQKLIDATQNLSQTLFI